MYYVTVYQPPRYHQMTLEEFLFGANEIPTLLTQNTANTRTYETDRISDAVLGKVDVVELLRILEAFNQHYGCLREADRHSLYREFRILKKSGGFRKISAPNEDLERALRSLKSIFENQFHALYHTSAFAYVRHRSTIDAVKRHQYNESKWYAKFDLHDFFGSTTPDFVMRMLSMIFPFSEVVKIPAGKQALADALDLAFLDGGLPQGTPLSPLLTNLIMIPIDYRLSNTLKNYNKQRFIYTRYADDFTISSKFDFKVGEIENLIVETLRAFDAPFELNRKKTHYGSSAGKNWMLGVMLNKDNQITVGAKKKREFKAMLTSYILDRQNGTPWDVSDIQVMEGLRSYYRMVEGQTIDDIVKKLSEKFGADIIACIKADLHP